MNRMPDGFFSSVIQHSLSKNRKRRMPDAGRRGGSFGSPYYIHPTSVSRRPPRREFRLCARLRPAWVARRDQFRRGAAGQSSARSSAHPKRSGDLSLLPARAIRYPVFATRRGRGWVGDRLSEHCGCGWVGAHAAAQHSVPVDAHAVARLSPPGRDHRSASFLPAQLDEE